MTTKLTETLEAIDAYFKSGNDIPIERATIRASEWQVLKDEVELLRKLHALGWAEAECPVCGSDMAIASQEAQAQDAERLDRLEADIRVFGAIHLHDGNHPAGHGLGLHGRTLREVIDAVRQADAALQAKEQSNG